MKRHNAKLVIISLLLVLSILLGCILTACEENIEPTPGGETPGGETPGGELPEIDVEEIEEEMFVSKGVSTGNLENKAVYYPATETKAEADALADRINRQIADEGSVLLYNNGALPLAYNERKVSLMGIASQDIVVAGGGSGSASQNNQSTKYDWNNAFEEQGFSINPKLANIYKGVKASGSGTNAQYLEIDPEEYIGGSVISTFNAYADAAIIVFHRWGTENADLRTYNAKGHSNPNDTELDLQDNEIAHIKLAKQYFSKVIVILNTSNTMDVSELAEPKTADNLGVDAILWVGGVGQVGCLEAVKILDGTVNPSGHLPDTWWADLKKDPAFTNVSLMSQNVEEDGTRMDTFFYTPDGEQTPFSAVEYREGVYMGHRYYETVYDDMIAYGASKEEADAWYDSVVAFPFGAGESYTTFEWQLAGESKSKVITSNAQTLTVKVKVTNTGSVAGKEVVQLYATAPYYNGGIEKASAQLIGFTKTKELLPGESQIVTIQIIADELAAFDWNDANNNGFKGYELEAGKYVLSVRRDSHNVEFGIEYEVKETILIDKDLESGADVKPVFTDDGYTDFSVVRDDYLDNMATRKDGMLCQPAAATKADRTLTEAEYELLLSQEFYTPWNDTADMPWYVKDSASLPADWTQAATAVSNEQLTTLRAALSGVPYHDPKVINGVVSFDHLTAAQKADNAKWDAYMNALTYEQLVTYYTGAKGPLSGGLTGSDGPVTFGGGADWVTCPVTAATWNLDLVYQQGEMLGTQAMLNGTTGWRGGGIDTHRTPFNGRCFEYYSEDGVLAAYIAKAIDTAVTSKGIMCYWKHYFCNDQEYRRANYGGISVFCTEQAMREIYLKPFEYVIKNGTMGLMTSFNRLGFIVNSGNYASHQKLLRDEWGFRGGTVNDRWCKGFSPQDMMLRAGDTYLLGSWNEYPDGGITWGKWDASARDGKGILLIPTEAECSQPGGNNKKDGTVPCATQYYVIRLAAQRDVYNEVNSMVMKNNATEMEFNVVAFAGINAKYKITSPDTKDVTIAGVSVTLPYPTAEELAEIEPEVTGTRQVTSGRQTVTQTQYTYTLESFKYAEWRQANGNVVEKVILPKSGNSVNINTVEGFRVTISADGSITSYVKDGITISTGVNTVQINSSTLGSFEVPVLVNVDSWIKNIPAVITVKVVSVLNANGVAIDGTEINVAKGSEVLIDSDYYRYMDVNSTNKHICISRYSLNGSTWMGRDEDASAADIVTLNYDKVANNPNLQKNEPSYNVTLADGEALPAGITIENVLVRPLGFAGLKYTSDIVDGVKIKVANSVAAGTYELKIAFETFTTNKPTGGSWFNASGARSTKVNQVITIVVE